MTLVVNGKPLEVADNATVASLVVRLGYQNQAIAVEINQCIIAKSEHSNVMLKHLDNIEIIKAIGGG